MNYCYVSLLYPFSHYIKLLLETDKSAVTAASYSIETRMWANAQRNGRPAEYRWRPLFNAAKFG